MDSLAALHQAPLSRSYPIRPSLPAIMPCTYRRPSPQPVLTSTRATTSQSPSIVTQYKSKTFPTRLLTPQEAIDALYNAQHPDQMTKYCSFYSSEYKGIVTDPALMVLQIDDHMIHRGHAVFESVSFVKGHVYQLNAHLDRLFINASKTNIPLPRNISISQLKRTVLETVAASKLMDGVVKIFLSSGRGGFGLSNEECLNSTGSTLYIVAIDQDIMQHDTPTEELAKGLCVKTSPVPIKSTFFAGIKSVNYLENVLCLMDAKADGYDIGVFVDSEGHVAEGPNANIAIITRDGTLVVPPFTHSLAGVTLRRVLSLLTDLIQSGDTSIEGISKIEQRPFTVSEAKSAVEVFTTNTTSLVSPVTRWDDREIGDGTAGIITMQLRVLLQNDMSNPSASEEGVHDEVPYGFLTGMGI